MKKLLIIPLLLLSLLQVEGQNIIRANPNARAQIAGGSPPITNMVSNGTFDDGTDWQAGGSWTITGGAAICPTSTTAWQSLAQLTGDMVTELAPDGTYTIYFDLQANQIPGQEFDAVIRIRSGGGTYTYVPQANYDSGAISLPFTVPNWDDELGIAIQVYTEIGWTTTVTIDNVRVVDT